MTHSIQLFSFKNHQIRTATENGEPIFCAKDVAAALGFKRPNDAVNQHCDGAVIRRSILDSLGRPQEARFIKEPDLFRLIMQAKTGGAGAFQDWVFSEVLPTIRKTGSYSIAIPPSYPDALIAYAQALREKETLAEISKLNAPKVAFAEAIAVSDDTMLIRDLARDIKSKLGADIGGKRLMEWMREYGYLIKKGADHNMPTQKSVNLGVLAVKQGSYTKDGETHISRTPVVTAKGQQYFFKQFGGQI